jgi:hypothetical protein
MSSCICPEQESALELWANTLRAAADGTEATNVLPFNHSAEISAF